MPKGDDLKFQASAATKAERKQRKEGENHRDHAHNSTAVAQKSLGLSTFRSFEHGQVTFGLLVARASDVSLANGIDRAAQELRQTNSLIGTALRLLTDDSTNQAALKTSLGTLTRVLDVVDWSTLSKGDPDAWLYFYEDFLEVYDNALRKRTGSYYTPPEVVGVMVRLVDEALRSPGLFDLPSGFASPDVTVADPAVGTGTFLLGVLRRIAATVEDDQGAGAIAAAIGAAVHRLIGFELQFGPFAVAQLRLLAETKALTQSTPGSTARVPELRLFVTDTLGNPFVEEERLPQMLQSHSTLTGPKVTIAISTRFIAKLSCDSSSLKA